MSTHELGAPTTNERGNPIEHSIARPANGRNLRGRARIRRHHALAALAVATTTLLAACGEREASSTSAAPSAAPSDHSMDAMGAAMDHPIASRDEATAMLASAGFQDVATAEAAGYASSLDVLGCFQNPERGGMGVHYINQSLMDDKVDITKPEALVYELDATGSITGLVAHEYIVPIDAWHQRRPPRLFGMDFHKHPTLPLWVLHAWLWKDNPTGVFQDWNPAVRQCPTGVPIFGQDLPKPEAPSTPTTAVEGAAGSTRSATHDEPTVSEPR
jgi:hypothetical protein